MLRRTLEAADWDWERGDHPQLGASEIGEASQDLIGNQVQSYRFNGIYSGLMGFYSDSMGY